MMQSRKYSSKKVGKEGVSKEEIILKIEENATDAQRVALGRAFRALWSFPLTPEYGHLRPSLYDEGGEG